MINCKKCGRPNEDHYRFCLGCGARLDHQKPASADTAEDEPARSASLASLSRPSQPEKLIICLKCGSAITTGNAFCGKCGAPAGDPPREETPSARAELVLIQTDGTEGHRIPLIDGETVIGRDHEHFTDDPYISPKHARFVVEGDGAVTVHDLESLNGVFVRLRQKQTLVDGDTLRVGLELLRYRAPDTLPSIAEPDEDDTQPQGSPTPPGWGRLERVATPEVCSHAWMLSRDAVVIGRDVGDIIFKNDGFVSGRHARLSPFEDTCQLEDLNSSNGTYVRLTAPRPIKHGDMLLIGQQIVLVAFPS